MTGGFQLPGQSVKEQIFAIGDVHGQAVTLEKTLERIAEIPGVGLPRHLVFTGDIIDRGPENLRSIDLVLDARRLAAVDQVTFLPGNHELMLLNAIYNPAESMTQWATYIGCHLLDEVDPEGKIQSVERIADLLSDRLMEFITLINAAPNALRIGDLVFVHAGLAPGYNIDDYLACPRFESDDGFNHWAWIGEPFLSHGGGWDTDKKIVVIHGHTPENRGFKLNPVYVYEYLDHVEKHRRICIDAGSRAMGQVALLQISRRNYTLEVVQDPPFDPVRDRCPDPSVVNEFKQNAKDLTL